jgi:hypothetical protein
VKLRKLERCVSSQQKTRFNQNWQIKGHGVDHASDVYRFLNPNTEQIIKSRDVIWLGKSFATWTKNQNGAKIEKIDDSDDEEEVQKDTQVNDEVEGVDKRKLDKAKREASKLKSWFNPDPKQFVENNQPGRELILDRVNLALNTTGKPK